jgi:poly-gamma-glutamate capsule biosynthesis protein CapA/YwtB (metallophosphatase superfamily)
MTRHPLRLVAAYALVLASTLAAGGLSACAGDPAAKWRKPVGAARATASPDLSAAGSQPPSVGSSASASGSVGSSASASGLAGSSADITLAFAGDVHFAGRTLALLNQPVTAFGPIAQQLSAADLAMVNLETAVTGRGIEEPKQFHFRAPDTAYEAIKAAGVDAVSIANNHALDYGRVGLADTVAAAQRAGVPAIGAGANAAAAYAPWITQVKGVRIAVLALSQIAELWTSWQATDNEAGIAMARDRSRAVAAVRAARAKADIVVVYVHWGVEGSACPSAEMRTFAQAMAQAGADVVVGTHAHLLLGDGWIGKTYVQYGLGNFLWWRDDSFSNDTGVLTVTIHGGRVVGTALVPASISRTTGQPVSVSDAERDRIAAKYASLRGCTRLASGPSK